MMEVNKIYQGDCLKIMKDWSSECVDLVLTDPPYNVGKDYGNGFNDKKKQKKYLEWYEDIFSEIYRIHKKGYLYVSCISQQTFLLKPIFEKIGYKYFQTLVWYRPNMSGGTKIIKMPWSLMYEPIMLFVKGTRDPMLNEVRGYLTHDVFVIPSPQSNYIQDKRYHITQKPIELCKRIIARTPGDICFDPFIGSGTTAVACLELKRNFVGIEQNPEYVGIANKRIEKIQQELF